MINPYYIYALSFLVSLVVYLLGWSTLFPSLKSNVIIFLISTIAISMVAGYFFKVKKYIEIRIINFNNKTSSVFVFIVCLWCLEFLYNRGIPLLLILKGAEYDYISFGIPTVHVFIVTFTSFFTTYLFHVYLSTKNRKVLIYYIILLAMPLLLFNRGMLLINLISSVFVYAQFTGRVSGKKILISAVCSLIVLYLFGVLGDIRTSHSREPGEPSSSKYILQIGAADDAFIQGPVPKEFFWSYLYIASPLGNLQYNIDIDNRNDQNLTSFILLLNNEYLFDFISKRIDAFLGKERIKSAKFIESLSVASVYTNSYIYFGWIGLCMMALFVLIFPVFYLGLVKKQNLFYVTATSTLCSLYLFLIYDNMFAFTGLSFQLVYPIVLNRIFQTKFKI